MFLRHRSLLVLLAAFTPQTYFWYTHILEAESSVGLYCGRKKCVNETAQLCNACPSLKEWGNITINFNHCLTVFRRGLQFALSLLTNKQVNLQISGIFVEYVNCQ
jgi:hypothetical protein